MFFPKRTTIEKSLYALVQGKDHGQDLQMDIYFKKEVIMQVFNLSGFKKIEWYEDLGIEDGIVVMINFNKYKPNNNDNLSRFKKSDYFKNYYEVKSIIGMEGTTYISTISTERKSNRELSLLIDKILQDVYKFSFFSYIDIIVRILD